MSLMIHNATIVMADEWRVLLNSAIAIQL